MSADILGQTLLTALTLASIYAIVALGLTLVFGVLDIVNFAQGEMVLGGAYVTYAVVSAGGPYWLGVAAGVLAFAAIGAILDSALFARTRKEPINGLLMSVGLIAILETVYLRIWGVQPLDVSTPLSGVGSIGGVVVPLNKVFVIISTIVILAAMAAFLRRARWGAALRAVGQNADAALLMGVPVERVRNLTFGLCAGLAALSGGLLVAILPAEPALAEDPLVKGFIVLILGGAGSPVGAVVGAIAVAFIESFGTQIWSAGVANMLAFAVLIAVLYFRPQGIVAPRNATAL